nr:probable tRNA methyltransferase 9B [Anolis sagrei ordinatus]
MEHEASQLEKQHVHSVYENTATYFNDLQGKAWPRVRQFLLEQKPGSLIADIGCGTGKYLGVNSQVYNLGCDYCGPLVEIAKTKGCEVMVCDNLNLPFRGQCFNAVISVGGSQLLSESNKVGHSTDIAHTGSSQSMHSCQVMGSKYSYPFTLDLKHPQRTDGCLAEACCVKISNGVENRFYRGLGRSFRSWFSSRSLDESALSKQNEKMESLKNTVGWTNSTVSIQPSRHCSLDLGCHGSLLKEPVDYDEVFMKHMACKKMEWLTASRSMRDFNGEPPALVQSHSGDASFLSSPVRNINNGYIHPSNTRPFPGKHIQRTSSVSSSESVVDAAVAVGNQADLGEDAKAFMRYYHVFREGELFALLEENVPEVHVLSSSYDHGNWCIIVKKNEPQQR